MTTYLMKSTIVLGAFLATSATALETQRDGQDLMAAAGQLGVLGQAAAASVCVIGAGVDVPAQTQTLALSRTVFNDQLAQLRGSLDLSTARAQDAQVAVQKIDAVWAQVDGAVSMILAGAPAVDHAPVVASLQADLLAATTGLLDAISDDFAAQYNVLIPAAMPANMEIRQELYAQQLKSHACAAATAGSDRDLQAELTLTVDFYDRSLAVLKDGLPKAGILPATGPQLVDLTSDQADWAGIKPVLTDIAQSGDASLAQLMHIADAALFDVRDGVLAPHFAQTNAQLAAEASVDLLRAPLN